MTQFRPFGRDTRWAGPGMVVLGGAMFGGAAVLLVPVLWATGPAWIAEPR